MNEEIDETKSRVDEIYKELRKMNDEIINLQAKRKAIGLSTRREKEVKVMTKLAEIARNKVSKGQKISFEEFKALMEIDKKL